MECTKILSEIKWPSLGDASQVWLSVILKFQPWDKVSVLCHIATGSPVSCHGLEKYWHSGFCEISLTLYIYAKGKKERQKAREKALLFVLKITD